MQFHLGTLGNLLAEVVKSLEDKGIPYMISGSLAMSAYTLPRMTRDVDIVIELSLNDVDTFIGLFHTNYYLHRPTIEEEIKRRGIFNVIDHRSGYKIDFIIKKASPFRVKEFERRARKSILGVDAWIVSVEDLILSKIIWIQEIQSETQISDINNMLAFVGTDRVYIGQWIRELNLKTFNIAGL